MEGKAKGFFPDRTRTGNLRLYRFEAEFDRGGRLVPSSLKVSACDPENRKSFSDRDGPGRPLREINGLPRESRTDLHERARHYAERARNKFLLLRSAAAVSPKPAV